VEADGAAAGERDVDFAVTWQDRLVTSVADQADAEALPRCSRLSIAGQHPGGKLFPDSLSGRVHVGPAF